MQWGASLVFWVGDKVIGGKMFCLVDLDASGKAVASFAAGPERYATLLEQEGLFPAPYLARAYWIAAEHWGALTTNEWQAELSAAREIVFAKLPARTRTALALPPKKRKKMIAARTRTLAPSKSTKSP